jgi:hypothetical protein
MTEVERETNPQHIQYIFKKVIKPFLTFFCNFFGGIPSAELSFNSYRTIFWKTGGKFISWNEPLMQFENTTFIMNS